MRATERMSMSGPLRAESQVINEGSTIQRGLFRSTEESDKGGRILQTQKIASAHMS